MKYKFDYIDNLKMPQMVIENDYTIRGTHEGTVHVENGTITILGELNGTLDVQQFRSNYNWSTTKTIIWN